MPLVDAWSHADVDRVMDAESALEPLKDDRDKAHRAVNLGLSLSRVIEDSAVEIEKRLEELRRGFQSPAP
jgi:hypothetical protein